LSIKDTRECFYSKTARGTMGYGRLDLVRTAPDDQHLPYMTKTQVKAMERSFGSSLLRSLALAGVFALVGPRVVRAESPAGKAGNEMERKGNTEEKAADA
jgi:hypothetical protein